ncbi:MAG: SIMPL domain-containing protein [Proteobacteria bacterium]|nr:SIMPL domain-containing protein [Pseudomonadota bacterium]
MRNLKFAAAFAVMLGLAAPPASLAQQAQMPMPAIEGTLLSVSAEGKVEGRPDMATINLGVQTEAPTAQAAIQANAQRMTALLAALRRAGIAERDIQTSNVSVNPQQQYRENQPPITTGYQANNTVTAKIRNIDNVGRVVDATVAAGGNTVNGIYFSYQNPDAQMDTARRNAIQEARRRAEIYASALNMRVARVVAVQEGGAMAQPIVVTAARFMRADAAPAPTPVEPGQIETTANVSVTFELR